MPYCSKCGREVSGEENYCPKCGANLRSRPYREIRLERDEKQEKEEKGEKDEKHEKREASLVGPIIGGLVLIFIGVCFYLVTLGAISFLTIGPFLLVFLGVLIIIAAVLAILSASKRNPRP